MSRKSFTIISLFFILAVNLADIYLTWEFYHTGLMTELNPLVLSFLNHSVLATFIYKVFCTLPICFLIIHLQNKKYYKTVNAIALSICFFLSLWWVQYLENEVKFYLESDINYILKLEEYRKLYPDNY
jgi:hypothetical protein